MAEAISRYLPYYKNQGVGILLIKGNGDVVASSVKSKNALQLIPESGERKVLVQSNSDGHLLLVGDTLQQGLTLVYERDIADLYRMREEQIRLMQFLNILGAIMLSGAAALLSRWLMHPLEHLRKAAVHLAHGDYSTALPSAGRDEVGELTAVFSQMAKAVRTREIELNNEASRKQEFIDNLAHEIRTPLTVISGFARLLQTANTTEEQRRRALSRITSEAKRLETLSAQLLMLSRVEHGSFTFDELDAAAFLQETVESLDWILNEKEVTLTVYAEKGTIQANADLLTLALRNLILNAINASDPKSEITLSYSPQPSVIEVADRGCGMTAEQLQHACEPFYRADSSRSRQAGGGTGLGLALVKKITEVHNAVLLISSREGGGTVARIMFTTALQPCDPQQPYMGKMRLRRYKNEKIHFRTSCYFFRSCSIVVDCCVRIGFTAWL
jgi:signal transduction histidine kinase